MIDSGLFHVFNDEDRRRYVEGLATVLKPGGRLFLMCFSDEEPGDAGAEAGVEEGTARRLRRGLEHRVHRAVPVEVRPDLKDLTFSEGGPKAWFVVTRKA